MHISVIIPVHNRCDLLLSRSLPSVLRQSRPPTEIIVVDDGSTDDLCETITRHAGFRCKKTDHGRYAVDFGPCSGLVIRQENQGVSAARNTGIRAASGDWVALLDSDDEWDSEKLKTQATAIADPTVNPEALRVCHTDEHWLRNGKPIRQQKHHARTGGWIFEACLASCCMSPSSILIQQSVFDEVGFFDESLPVCEDYDLWLRIAARMPVLCLNTPLLTKYGGHADQLSTRTPIMDRYRIYALEKLALDQSIDSNARQQARNELLRRTELLLAGARKRNNIAIEAEFTAIEQRWRQ
jgi:glycosyltransferase involved in cell wall biosynthesis